MKDKILFLIIGVLIGAVVTAGGFLIFGNNDSGMPQDGMKQMDGNFTGGRDGNMTRPDDANMTKPDDANMVEPGNASTATESNT